MNPLQLVEACRGCGNASLQKVLSLGHTPLANALLASEETESPTYPLTLVRCVTCGLVQIAEIVAPEVLFSDYVYFSSNSETMLRHAEAFTNQLVQREQLSADSLVVEIASNDGYLLQYIKQRDIGVLGIEPAANIAEYAEREKGIRTLARFFGSELAQDLVSQGTRADVIIGNNVLAHVPALNDFITGVATLLERNGVAIFEVPYVRDMLEQVEFDTIYHEHQCYFSLTALQHVFKPHGLDIVDVERLVIHGGSLRVTFAQQGRRQPSAAVAELLNEERAWCVLDAAPYDRFSRSVVALKVSLLQLLDGVKADGARVAAYGAAAKGVTLASYCGVGRNYLDFVVDRSPHKQGRRFPVDGLAILPPAALLEQQPDYALLFTWNFADEILHQQSDYINRGGRFIVPVPTPRVVAANQYVA